MRSRAASPVLSADLGSGRTVSRFLRENCKHLVNCLGAFRRHVEPMSWIDMAPEIETRIVSEPHLFLIILPHKRPQWNVDGQGWCSFHWLGAKVGIAKHNHGARLQREFVLASCSGVINFGKNHPSYASLGLNGLLKTLHGFLNRVVAGFRDQS